MASSTPKTIVLKGDPPREEARGDAAITPGDLLQFAADLDVDVHSTQGGNAAPIFALENPYADDNTVAAIDHDYATGEYVRYSICGSGDVVYAWLTANGSVDAAGYVQSAGNGALEAWAGGTATPEAVVGQALESVNGQTVNARIKIMVV